MQYETGDRALCDAGVEFVLVGGVAGVIHGSAMVTLVLDICYSRSRPNLRLLALALARFHPRLRNPPGDLPFLWDVTTWRNGNLFTLTTDLGDIDLLAEVSGVGAFDDVLAGSVEADAFGRRVRTLDLPSLIKSKRAAGRPKDLAMIPELESLLETRE